jgi:Ni/Co efflux regulator RcnB
MPLLHRSLSPFLLGAALALAVAPALAEKPPHAGGGKHGQAEEKAKGGGKPHKGGGGGGDRDSGARHAPSGGDRTNISVNVQIGGYFTDAQRRTVVDYYEPRFRAGNCPPGLAKKNNGCMPPGQAKKWRRGAPLPHDVIYYPVPDSVSIRLGVPPSGHKYVRVATDILLIAVGTGMVIDAIEDLSRL